MGELRKTHRGLLTAWCDQPHSIVGCLNRKEVRRIADEEHEAYALPRAATIAAALALWPVAGLPWAQ